MLRARAIPVLSLRRRGLVKTFQFRDSVYLGDPRNAVRIFNEKRVDEIIVADIDAPRTGNGPNLDFLRQILDEAFMPVCYAGGVRTLDDFRSLMRIGVEKIAVNSELHRNPVIIDQAAREFGSSTVVASIDYRGNAAEGGIVFSDGGSRNTGREVRDVLLEVVNRGAGEILLTSIDRDGMRTGYDLDGVRAAVSAVGVPLIANGGARSIADMGRVVSESGAAGAAAGSMFVFRESKKAILISYPEREDLDREFAR